MDHQGKGTLALPLRFKDCYVNAHV